MPGHLNLSVSSGSRIERLPIGLRPLAILAREGATALRSLGRALSATMSHAPRCWERFGIIRGSAVPIRDWAAGAIVSGEFHEISPSARITRRVPDVFGDSDVLRRALEREQRWTFDPFDAIKLDEAFVLPDGVVTTDGTLLLETALNATNARPPRVAKKRLRTVDGPTFVLARPWSDGYAHWLSDCLPLLAAHREVVPDARVVVRAPLNRWHRESLLAYGFDDADIEVLLPRECVRVRHAIVPGLLGHPGAHHPTGVRFLRDVYLPRHVDGRDTPARRLHISRRFADKRRMVDEDGVTRLLVQYAIETIYAEDLPFLEQVRTFADAELIIGVHGAGLANTVFCAPGTAVIEIFPRMYSPVCIWHIADTVGHRYIPVVAEQSVGVRRGLSPGHHDVIVGHDNDLIRRALESSRVGL